MSNRVMALFMEALELEGDARACFLDEACGNDPELRRELDGRLSMETCAESLFGSIACFEERIRGRFQEGETVGPYTILRQIGHGGMGTVYLAEHQFQGKVALKVLKPGMDTEALVRRFHRERRIVAHLDHPNIARMIDGGATEDGLPYFIMEYIEGRPLHHYCDAQRLTIDQRLDIFAGVCDGVDKAHQHLIIHRDIKPGNIMVGEDGVPRLLDFGIARVLEDDEEVTQTLSQHRMMTPEYAAPEQLMGLPVSVAGDVYSLGVLLYELLSGHRPFRTASRSNEEWRRLICDSNPGKPSDALMQTRPGKNGAGEAVTWTPELVAHMRGETPKRLRHILSGDLDKIILKAMHKEPERRYRSAADFAADVRRYLEGMPIKARKDTPVYRLRKFVGRNPLSLSAVLLLLVIVFVVDHVTFLQEKEERLRREVAQKQQQIKAQFDMAVRSVDTMLALYDPTQNGGMMDLPIEHLNQVIKVIGERNKDDITHGMLLLRCAEVYIERDHVRESYDTYQKALELLENRSGSPNILRAKAYNGLARASLSMTRKDESLAAVAKAAALLEDTPDTHLEWGRNYFVQGMLARVNQDSLGALEKTARAYRIIKHYEAEEPRLLARVMTDYSLGLMVTRRFQEAESFLRETIRLKEKEAGKASSYLQVNYVNLANALDHLGKHDEARAILHERLEIAVRHNPKNDVTVFLSTLFLTEHYIRLHRSVQARQVMAQVTPPTDDTPTLLFSRHRMIFNAAMIDMLAGRAEAGLTRLQALMADKDRYYPILWDDVRGFRVLGNLYRQTGYFAKAAAALDKAQELADKHLVADHDYRALIFAERGRLAMAQNDPAVAREWLTRAHAMFLKCIPADHLLPQGVIYDLKLCETWLQTGQKPETSWERHIRERALAGERIQSDRLASKRDEVFKAPGPSPGGSGPTKDP